MRQTGRFGVSLNVFVVRKLVVVVGLPHRRQSSGLEVSPGRRRHAPAKTEARLCILSILTLPAQLVAMASSSFNGEQSDWMRAHLREMETEKRT